MKTDDIVILDNDERYVLLSQIEYENEIYFLACNADEENNFNFKKIVIFLKEDDENLTIITDKQMIIKLTPLLQNAIDTEN